MAMTENIRYSHNPVGITYSLPEPRGRPTSVGVGVLAAGLSTVTVVLLPLAGLPTAPPGRRLRPRLALSYAWFLSEKPNG